MGDSVEYTFDFDKCILDQIKIVIGQFIVWKLHPDSEIAAMLDDLKPGWIVFIQLKFVADSESLHHGRRADELVQIVTELLNLDQLAHTGGLPLRENRDFQMFCFRLQRNILS